MSTSTFNNQPAQCVGRDAQAQLQLNGFRLSLSQATFQAQTLPLSDNSTLKELRSVHGDWFLYWREGMLYAVPRKEVPATTVGTPETLPCTDHLQMLAALIEDFLPRKFPKYEAFRVRPFSFIGKREELVGTISPRLRNAPPLLRDFSIRPTFTLEAKIIEPVSDQTSLGLFLTVNTKWAISADLSALQAAGVDLAGLYVVRREQAQGERWLIGQIKNVEGDTVQLAASYDEQTTIAAKEVTLEGSKTSFARCLKTLLGRDYDVFEQGRQREEAKLLSGRAINELLQQFHLFFQKDPKLALTRDLTVTIGDQLNVSNTSEYHTIHCAPPVQYYFDPARTKASPFPWVGIKQYGPFSKDTFPKRTPNILVIFPETAQGATETFLSHLRNGITSISRSQYEGGFAKLFGLLNPSFTLCRVPSLRAANPADAYRRAIEEQLAAAPNVDAAIVVLADQQATLPDASSPYLVAKATLMLAGIPAQEIKVSKLSVAPYALQYILQNFTVALYAKMNGTPWTVNQDTTISDELIIGIGTSEISTSRFSKRSRYVGITTVFRGDGNYLLGHVSKDCTYEEYPAVLQQSTENILQDIKQRNGWNRGDNIRLIFHTYKPLKNIEIAEIAKRAALVVGSEQGRPTETVRLINWNEPEKNDFAIAEEVTLKGNHERRPDIVLYVNGIAIGVLELKNSRISIGDGIRQNLSNQQPEFNSWFFSTVQLIFAGNDTEGLQYGTIGTPEKYFLKWKEDEKDNTRFKLDKYLLKMCQKDRLIELMHDFVLFDGGKKKVPRVHQYFGIKAAQEHVRQRKGGIIWHTQGSGKSIVMVLLAKWIVENNPNARVAIITDRDELDKQIEGVFRESGEAISRTTSGNDLMAQLAQAKPRLLCSLVHKFGARNVENFDAFIKELEAQPSKTVGELFVFVDECHRTQSGKLNKVMKAMMPNAVFIGFTGTPLLKKDKATSLEVFGGYIHTYKFSEAVEDEVVLDLVYEARDIDQRLGSQQKIDAWFEAKTKGLNDWQRDELKKKWGTMQHVLSSKSRMDRVVSDIVFDFSVKPRLSSERGNAILVASSIYEGCKYFSLFQKTPFKGQCAVVTSYNPQSQDVTKEEVGANTETDKQFIFNTYTELLKDVTPKSQMSKTETYEENAKQLFINEPASMKLLVVVDKLLTGFDAPPCTYLYIDKSMQDHGLFQAICRVNRLDGEDKDFGYIVDYKDLFKKVENAISVYTSELDHSAGGVNPEVLLQDRLKKGKERLDNAVETLSVLCEPVEPPKGELEYIHYFCGNTEISTDLEEREPHRAALYKATAGLVRAYANIADELEASGYSASDVTRIKQDLEYYLNLREIIRKASGESLDLKAYEADMRHLIDTYIEADEPRKISPFDNMGLLELIVKTGIAQAIAAQLGGLKGNQGAIAETIENNVRRKIIKEHLNDPAFYDSMSSLLDEIIASRRAKAIEYEEYLRRIAELAKRVEVGQSEDTPKELKTPGMRALFNNLGKDLDLALRIDKVIKQVRPDGWRGVQAREQIIKRALYEELKGMVADDVESEVERIFLIVKQQREY